MKKYEIRARYVHSNFALNLFNDTEIRDEIRKWHIFANILSSSTVTLIQENFITGFNGTHAYFKDKNITIHCHEKIL